MSSGRGWLRLDGGSEGSRCGSLDPKVWEVGGGGRGSAAPAVALTAFLSHLGGFLSPAVSLGVFSPLVPAVPQAFASLLPVTCLWRCVPVFCSRHLTPVLQEISCLGLLPCGMIGPELQLCRWASSYLGPGEMLGQVPCSGEANLIF